MSMGEHVIPLRTKRHSGFSWYTSESALHECLNTLQNNSEKSEKKADDATVRLARIVQEGGRSVKKTVQFTRSSELQH